MSVLFSSSAPSSQAFGLVVLYWMSLLHRKHSHTDVTIQVALTLVAAYSCFYVAEAILGMSGVLATVTMGGLPGLTQCTHSPLYP